MNLQETLKKNGLNLPIGGILDIQMGPIYSGKEIRDAISELNPTLVRQAWIESINDAKEKQSESLEKRIPDESKQEFNLEISWENNPKGENGVLHFQYFPISGGYKLRDFYMK